MSLESPPSMTIVALIALPEEFDVFQEVFPYKKDLSAERWMCIEHETSKSDVRLISILAEQMGSQSASISADIALANFSPDLIIVVGIAGGVSTDLGIADVCVSNEIIDVLHNNKVSSGGSVSFAPDFHGVDAELVSSFAFLRTHPSLKSLYREWQDEAGKVGCAITTTEGEVAKPNLYIGPIACGPVSASAAFNRKLKSLHRKVMAIETESGGVFQKVSNAKVPAVAIRGISDMANSDKSALELRTKGSARRTAMLNASRLLAVQLSNPRFMNVVRRAAASKDMPISGPFHTTQPVENIVVELEKEIVDKLKELSSEVRARPDGFYLPVPRARRISYADELTGRALDEPVNIVDCLASHDRIMLRLPRTFPNQALGLSLAHSLLTQQINGKVVLPFVVKGQDIRPPNFGLINALSSRMQRAATDEDFTRVFIIEEPNFASRSRMKFLAEEMKGKSAKILVITKVEDHAATVDDFIRENAIADFELAPVSFSETAFFLERAFDMNPREAEAVAIRLDDTFRKFRLDAHPTYFAGLQEETLAALINANKRAELIQLAVDGLLSLIVAADKSKPNLSRTTRERFLRRLVLEMAVGEDRVDDSKLSGLAGVFLKEYAFDISQIEFLNPFFRNGILYQASGAIFFTHPYLESYLLATALREQEEIAHIYFDPNRANFNYYAYDLYCELGAADHTIVSIRNFAKDALNQAGSLYAGQHIYTERGRRLTALSTKSQLAILTSALVETAEKLERQSTNDDVRAEKQRILDTKRHVRSEVSSRNPLAREALPAEIKSEFQILDQLSRALHLCSIAVGSGSEALDATTKTQLAECVLMLGSKFSDIWTRNRLRIDFAQVREEMLTDEKIWQYIEDIGADQSDFQSIKTEIEVLLHGTELNAILEPMGRVLWNISSAAGVKVLAPILQGLNPDEPIQQIIRACWLMDVDAARGNERLKEALSDYSGSQLLRIVLAGHLLWRVFWHHYKTSRSGHFVSSAKRILRPIGLAPTVKRLEEVKRGPNAQISTDTDEEY